MCHTYANCAGIMIRDLYRICSQEEEQPHDISRISAVKLAAVLLAHKATAQGFRCHCRCSQAGCRGSHRLFPDFGLETHLRRERRLAIALPASARGMSKDWDLQCITEYSSNPTTSPYHYQATR